MLFYLILKQEELNNYIIFRVENAEQQQDISPIELPSSDTELSDDR